MDPSASPFPGSPTPAACPSKSASGSVIDNDRPILSSSSSDSDDASSQDPASPRNQPLPFRNPSPQSSEPGSSSDSDEIATGQSNQHQTPPSGLRQCVAMYSSQREFDPATIADGDEDLISKKDLTDPRNRTALDVAVLENITRANIHKLVDLLHYESGMREKFMSWLWKLTDFNASDVVTLEELRVLLAALSEDGIDLDELVFYKDGALPLEECVINEFDTTHAGLLNRDEFMVLADLVTREYEFWENRHLERVGDYELERCIGRGSSGVVRLARHVETGEKVAIKIIKKGKCSDLSRLDREIESLMAAKHEHIVALQEVLDSEDNLFIVMELCGGGSLVDMVRLYPKERMPEDTARFFMRQVFEALAFCHRNGICHRDVRLENLMLDNAGNVKITDFGHSGTFTPGWDLFSTALVGSLYNISPEQISGQLYSGEKIDVWSAGVTVFCLLVGLPPFYEPDVNSLMTRITACDFEVPDFVSPKARDLIHCMIRANPDERIPLQQMLHHPWFYDGQECGPSMKTVVIPVDDLFASRPDVAEVIMAITIYQHNLHFHLADTDNPKASPEDQRGQEWTLKCLDTKNDLKFTISLFTKEPCTLEEQKKARLPAVASCAAFSELSTASDCVNPGPTLQKIGSVGLKLGEETNGLPDNSRLTRETLGIHSRRKSVASSAKLLSASRPPVHRKMVKITPLAIAAHLRTRKPSSLDDEDDFEIESEYCDQMAAAHDSQKAEAKPRTEKREMGSAKRKCRRGRHSRSHSLDDPDVMRINQSATVDAFPYQKVYPQRSMPDSARHLNFDKPEASSSFGDVFNNIEKKFSDDCELDTRPRKLNGFHRSITMHAVSSLRADAYGRGSRGYGMRDNEITLKLSRHPSKGVSPQSPQIRVSPMESLLAGVEDLSLTSAKAGTGAGGLGLVAVGDFDFESDEETEGKKLKPYIEVRWQSGESGVFLKVCRKLKIICTTKLAAAAERQKRKSSGRQGSFSLGRSDSYGGLKSEEEDMGGGSGVSGYGMLD